MVNLKKLMAFIASIGIFAGSIGGVAAEDPVEAASDATETIVGGYDFENITDYIGERFLQSTVPQVLPLEGGVQLELGARSSGANGTTGWYAGNFDDGHGSAAQANIGEYVSSDRGPFMSFDVDQSKTEGQRVGLRFEYYPVNGTGNTADLYIVDPITNVTVAQLIVGQDINENEWNKIEISVETTGVASIIINDSTVLSGSMTASTYPQLKFTDVNSSKNAQSRGNIDNVELYTGGALSDQELLGIYLSSATIDTEQGTIVLNEDGESYDVMGSFELPTSDSLDIQWSVEQTRIEDPEATENPDATTGPAPQFVVLDGNTANVTLTEDIENYDIRLKMTASYGEATTEREYILHLMAPSSVLEAYADEVVLTDGDGTELTPGEGDMYSIDSDLALTQGDGLVSVSWACYKPDGTESGIIDGSGRYYPTDYTGELKLVATLSFMGQTLPHEFKVASTINAVETYIDPAIEAATAKSADDETVVYEDIKNIGTIKNDIVLPVVAECEDGQVDVKWEVVSGTENASVDEAGKVTIMTSDLEEHEVTMKATYSYVKNDIETVSKTVDGYKFTVSFTEDDINSSNKALAKYKVRFDAAYDDNFSDIPSRATSNITLPSKGYFGSTITWNSSNPSAITNAGKVSRGSSNKTVTMTASIVADGTGESSQRAFEITVPGTGSSGGSGGGGGGRPSSTGVTSTGGGGAIASSQGSTSPSTATNPTGQEAVDQLLEQKEQAENRFTDIGGVSWARDAINGLYDAGIINGKGDSLFAPNDTVTRAEFAKMLMGVFDLTSDAFTTSSFYDVAVDSWYFQSVESAYNLGVINGVADGWFDPNANITRQDMAVMVMRAATVSGKTLTATTEAKNFSDAGSISDYAKDAVTTLQTAGIINGVSDYEFAPLSNATRAQAAQILYSFL